MNTQRIIDLIEKSNLRTAALPHFRAGDSLKVSVKIREGEKTRTQAFEGVCIARQSNGVRSTFTVRKISYGVGVERVFPDHSPNIEKVEVISRGRVRQARLFYLRDLSGKAARIKERDGQYANAEADAEAAVNAEAAAAADTLSSEEKAKINGRGARKRKKEGAQA